MNQFVKKAAVVMAAIFTLSTSYSFAASNGNDDNEKEVKGYFQHDFQNAKLMSTEIRVQYSKVVFEMNGQVMNAFYSNNGELMAVTRNLISSQLPVSLLVSFKKHYGDYWITDLFEMSQDSQSSYYLTLENADSKTVLRSNGDSWETYSVTKK